MKIGFIGTGKMALSHAQVTESLGHEVAYAFGKLNSDSVNLFLDKFQTCKGFYELDAFLAEEECDAIIVTTPPSVTQELLPSLITSQKFVLAEKPGFLSSKAGMNLINNGRIFFGYNRRFYSSIVQFKNLIEGRKTHLSILISEKDVLSTEEKCDIFVNNSVHYFDLVNNLFPGSKFENFRVGVNRVRVDADIIHQGSFLGTFSIMFGVPMNSEINAISTGQLVVLKPIEVCSVADGMIVKDPSNENLIRIYEPVIQSLATPSEDLNFKPGIYAQDQEFFEMVLGKTDHNLASFNDAIANLETAELFSKVLKGFSS